LPRCRRKVRALPPREHVKFPDGGQESFLSRGSRRTADAPFLRIHAIQYVPAVNATPFESGWKQPSEVEPSLNTALNDYRGWFYRVVAPHSDISVMQTGVVVADRWFTNVVDGDMGSLVRPPPVTPSLDMVILHGTLGGHSSIGEALRAAHGLLRRDGLVALAGYNRLHPALRNRASEGHVPRATLWGYRLAARGAGFSNVRVYSAQPDFDAPNVVVSTDWASAGAFHRAELEAHAVSAGVRFRRLRSAMIELHLAPHLQACYIVVARKC
jgi:hypothetical protein